MDKPVPYLLMVSHGKGRHYFQGGGDVFHCLTLAARAGKAMAMRLNQNKKPRAPKVTVTLLRIVEVYDGNSVT